MSEPLDLQGRHIVLGLSGGIACYKSAELVRELVRHGATVQVVMTDAAAMFITAGDDAGAVATAASTPASGTRASPTPWRTST